MTHNPQQDGGERRGPESEVVEVSGHIIDSLILPKILDCITAAGGRFDIEQIAIGHARRDASYARIRVSADTRELLDEILGTIQDHGARAVEESDCRLEAADMDGAFPEGFYSSTNQRTAIRHQGAWIECQDQEMDCGVVLQADSASTWTARCVAMSEIRHGDLVVLGHMGVRVYPTERESEQRQSFEFMNSAVSTEKPKGVAIRQVARQLHDLRERGGRALIVGGPAIIHTGSGPHLCQLLERGYFQLLFAGNALATHDIEQSMFGTSLGVHLASGDLVDAGHEHHLRAINRVRRAGSIRGAVERGWITGGVMHSCVMNGIDFVLAGSIRDDGPLPDVITDALEAQRVMRQKVHGLDFCLMIATTLHSVAVGNLLPAWVKVVCVDINPSTVIKLSDRGSFQTVGLVTDVEPFLRALVQELERLESE
ncbi:MAG: TIGR00300 family protein [Planctomycetales bacterium]|nr:TIGR00300 family protein [Planctomycetales bacterium]